VQCNASTAPAATGTATAIGNCNGTITISSSDAITPGVCPQSYTITRTWKAVDACNNSASGVQIITVVDTTAPVLTLPANTTVSKGVVSSNQQPPESIDNCQSVKSLLFTYFKHFCLFLNTDVQTHMIHPVHPFFLSGAMQCFHGTCLYRQSHGTCWYRHSHSH
jgi:hypothetical protein